MEKFDAVIVGGSSAGAAAGYALARAGKKVAIFELARFPREKICGGMITEKTIRLLTEIYGEIDLSEVVDSSYSAFSIHYRPLGPIGKTVRPDKKLYFVDRSIFDHYFLKKAKAAGCVVFEGVAVVKVEDSAVFLASGEKVEAPFIIGADGAMSVTRRAVTSEVRKERFALATEVDLDRAVLSFLPKGEQIPQIYFGYLEEGYGWIFPKSDRVTVGVGGVLSKNDRNMRDVLCEFIDEVFGGKDVRKDIRSFSVPFQNFMNAPVRKNVLLTGDAAGFVEPITGEGIYFAMLSGLLAAQAIIAGEDPGRAYLRAVKKMIYPSFRQAYFMKKLFFSPRVLRFAMQKMKNNKKYCTYYFDLLSGELSYVGYIWKTLLDRRTYH